VFEQEEEQFIDPGEMSASTCKGTMSAQEHDVSTIPNTDLPPRLLTVEEQTQIPPEVHSSLDAILASCVELYPFEERLLRFEQVTEDNGQQLFRQFVNLYASDSKGHQTLAHSVFFLLLTEEEKSAGGKNKEKTCAVTLHLTSWPNSEKRTQEEPMHFSY
jgi:hypothetical protein